MVPARPRGSPSSETMESVAYLVGSLDSTTQPPSFHTSPNTSHTSHTLPHTSHTLPHTSHTLPLGHMT